MDIGTSHRSGTRFGPRQIRAESGDDPALQYVDQAFRPSTRCKMADIGDIAIDTFDLKRSVALIEEAYDRDPGSTM